MDNHLHQIKAANFRRNIQTNDSLSISAILTHQEMKDYKDLKGVTKVEVDTSWYKFYGTVYPHKNPCWDWGNMGPLWIPKKGATIKLDSVNLFQICRCHKQTREHKNRKNKSKVMK